MNLAHIHLLLNHFPTIGFGIGLCLFFAALYGKNDHLRQASLVVFFLIAVVAIPTYLSGNFAEARICPDQTCPPGVSVPLIRAHEDAALLAFALMELTGFFAWLGLWQHRRNAHLPTWNMGALVLLSIATFGLMARAASIGGEIRHPEIQTTQAAAVSEREEATGLAKSIGEVMSGATGNSWLWPASETLHFIGLCLLFTVVLMVDLRILGMAKTVSFAAFYQLLPLGMLGFTINLITGMLFFIGKPGQYMSEIFYWKILFIVIGGLNVLYFMLIDEAWAVGAGDDAPIKAKFVAVTAIFLWLAVLYCGHMLPFRGSSF